MILLTNFIFITGIIINLVILLLLFKIQNKNESQKILIVIFLLLLFVIIDSYAILHKIKWLYIFAFNIDNISIWLIAPLFYLYTKSIFSKDEKLIKKNLFHFIPALLMLVFVIIPLFLSVLFNLVVDYMDFYIQNINPIALVQDLYFLIYSLVTLNLYFSSQKKMKQLHSNHDKLEFGWVKIMLFGSIVVISIDTISTLFEIFYTNLPYNSGFITNISITFFLVYLVYYGISKSQISLLNFSTKNESQKHHLSNASDEEKQSLQIKLETILNKYKPYLDETLTLKKLAEQLPTTEKKLSALLNKHMHTTFYHLINKYRLETAKERIKNSSDNLLSIAFDSGFKSKSSFNRIFKKETGLSPSQYRKN